MGFGELIEQPGDHHGLIDFGALGRKQIFDSIDIDKREIRPGARGR